MKARLLTRSQLSFYYDIPIRVTTNICEELYKAKLINYVMLPDDKVGVAPASETDSLTVGNFCNASMQWATMISSPFLYNISSDTRQNRLLAQQEL